MFEQLSDIRQPDINRRSVARILVAVFLLGMVFGVRLTSFAYRDHWKTWDPFSEIMFWFWVIPACSVVWRYIPAILDRLPSRQDSTGKNVL